MTVTLPGLLFEESMEAVALKTSSGAASPTRSIISGSGRKSWNVPGAAIGTGSDGKSLVGSVKVDPVDEAMEAVAPS